MLVHKVLDKANHKTEDVDKVGAYDVNKAKKVALLSSYHVLIAVFKSLKCNSSQEVHEKFIIMN